MGSTRDRVGEEVELDSIKETGEVANKKAESQRVARIGPARPGPVSLTLFK